MSEFQFHPQLFEERTRVMEALSSAGYEWLSHYSSVDVIHDQHGIEVCGIRDKDDAGSIRALIGRLYPRWHSNKLAFKDFGIEPGYKAKVYRDRRPRDDGWQLA